MKQKTTKQPNVNPGSFRDPDGFVYTRKGQIFRQIHESYEANYHKLMTSGLYQELVEAGLLLPHEEVDITNKADGKAKIVIKPVKIPFISYPYEWSFSQLKDAALVTLQIQKKAIEKGMSLKDASGYNIQFLKGRPIFIDTLSFEAYDEGSPWVAYRQFCQQFLVPLALASYVDIDLVQLLKIHIDGIPLQLASRLLPAKSWLNFGITTHIHMHAKSQQKYQSGNQKTTKPQTGSFNQSQMLGLIANLEATVQHLNWRVENQSTEWGNYYQQTNYSDKAFGDKSRDISRWIKQIKPQMVWDVGANNGEFSLLASKMKICTIAMDIDPVAVEKNYLRAKEEQDEYMLPLRMDITNPSAAIGWANEERASLQQRGPADLILALALLHHLVIGANVPMERVAQEFARLGKQLVIEFVPKDDSQVQKLLASREDIFDAYTETEFEKVFGTFFKLKEKAAISESLRTLYWYEA